MIKVHHFLVKLPVGGEGRGRGRGGEGKGREGKGREGKRRGRERERKAREEKESVNTVLTNLRISASIAL